jgi:hypothetical protein
MQSPTEMHKLMYLSLNGFQWQQGLVFIGVELCLLFIYFIN